jgi:PKD repeat protein
MKKLSMLLVAVVILFTSCKKEPPQACFTQPKLIVKKGETIQFTNCSQNAKHYKWVLMPGNKSATTPNISVDFIEIGVYSLSLTAYNKDKSKSDVMTKNITVEN